MFIFIVYAVLVWWGAYHWRRHVLGFASVLVGVGLCVLAGMAHTWLGNMTEGQIFMPVFQGLLYPSTALLLMVGACFVFAPVHTGGRAAMNSTLCRGCGYDLAGLERRVRRCPECALPRSWARDERHCLHCDLDITHLAVNASECPGCGAHPRMRARRSTASGVVEASTVPEARVATFRPLISRADQPPISP